jgi:hypothetical protein
LLTSYILAERDRSLLFNGQIAFIDCTFLAL